MCVCRPFNGMLDALGGKILDDITEAQLKIRPENIDVRFDDPQFTHTPTSQLLFSTWIMNMNEEERIGKEQGRGRG